MPESRVVAEVVVGQGLAGGLVQASVVVKGVAPYLRMAGRPSLIKK